MNGFLYIMLMFHEIWKRKNKDKNKNKSDAKNKKD